ncbi:MAG: hypothetical protein JW943_13190 [Deltaproteobacteria bacterium]|nr:hypothetical protein [Deltaproteobacteria bacterium]
MNRIRISDEINDAYVGPHGQMSLFNRHPREVCNDIGLNWITALSLYDKGWLSFDPKSKTDVDDHEATELYFIGSLAAWGFDDSQIELLLKGLQKPYAYKIDKIYYDWLTKKWRLLPNLSDMDDVQSFIEALLQEGAVNLLQSMHEQISEALGINPMNCREKIIADIAASECNIISKKIIRHFRAMKEGMQSGDDTPLENIWDEICVQARGNESVMWNVYQDNVRVAIRGEVENLNATIKRPICLQTEAGIDWAMDSDVDHEEVIFCEEDITEYILQKFVLPAAANWYNKR